MLKGDAETHLSGVRTFKIPSPVVKFASTYLRKSQSRNRKIYMSNKTIK